MVTPNSNSAMSSNGIRSILEKEKLNENNFLDCYRNFKSEMKLDVLENPLPAEPTLRASTETRQAYDMAVAISLDVTCLMLASMNSELKKQFGDMEAFDIIHQLRAMFQKQARIERYETVKAILESSLKESEPVGPHVLK